MAEASLQRPPTRVPVFIRWSGPLVRLLLGSGLPLGPNVVLTIRGRKSGEARPQPLAVIGTGDQRYVVGAFGDVNWCRNLRANPNAEIRRGRTVESVRARELTRAEATEFFRDGLPSIEARMPLFSRVLARIFIRAAAPEIRTDPASAAATRPVFQLLSAQDRRPD